MDAFTARLNVINGLIEAASKQGKEEIKLEKRINSNMASILRERGFNVDEYFYDNETCREVSLITWR